MISFNDAIANIHIPAVWINEVPLGINITLNMIGHYILVDTFKPPYQIMMLCVLHAYRQAAS